MRASVICICAFFVVGSVLSLPQKFDKEYEIPPGQSYVEVHEIHVNSDVFDRFKRTNIKFELKNHQDRQHEFQFSILLPQNNSMIDKLELNVNQRGFGMIGFIKKHKCEMTDVNKLDYLDLAAKQIPVALVEKDPKDPERYNVFVNLPANTECSVEVHTAEMLPLKDNQFSFVTKIETNLDVNRLYYHVSIRDRRLIKRVTTNGPKTEQSKNDLDTLSNVNVVKLGPSMVVVDFNPDQNQIRQIFGCSDKKEGASRKVDFVIQCQLEDIRTFDYNYHHRISHLPEYRGFGYRGKRSLNIGVYRSKFDGGNQYITTRQALRSPSIASGISPNEWEKINAIKMLNPGAVPFNVISRLKNMEVVSSVTSLLVALPLNDNQVRSMHLNY